MLPNCSPENNYNCPHWKPHREKPDSPWTLQMICCPLAEILYRVGARVSLLSPGSLLLFNQEEFNQFLKYILADETSWGWAFRSSGPANREPWEFGVLIWRIWIVHWLNKPDFMNQRSRLLHKKWEQRRRLRLRLRNNHPIHIHKSFYLGMVRWLPKQHEKQALGLQCQTSIRIKVVV